MKVMRRALLLLLLATALWAQRAWTIAQLQAFIKSSVELKQPDKQVADVLKGIRLTQRLAPGDVEDIQAMGAGPRTVEALRALSAASSSLAVPPTQAPVAAPKPLPPPSAAEQKQVLAEVTKNALDYTKNLPNFICTQD